jgi:hypothetical protein
MVAMKVPAVHLELGLKWLQQKLLQAVLGF